MTGLEKIIAQILDEAGSTAKSALAKAKEEAAAIVEAAEAESSLRSQEILQKSEAEVAGYLERIHSSAELQSKKAILKAKQEVILEITRKAYEQLISQDTESYFGMIKRMLEKFALPEEGDIYLSEFDLKRLPVGFEAEIEKIAEAKGGRLTLSNEGKKLDGGFILVYGGVEENCSFRALFNANKDIFQDEVNQLLFM